jgi:hypothetical protein
VSSPQLETHIRQFFAYTTLLRADRYEEAKPSFTFRSADLLLSVFSEAFALLASANDAEQTPALLTYAQVFERFSSAGAEGVDKESTSRTAAAFYWLAGYGANSLVMARSLERTIHERRRLAERRSLSRPITTLSDALIATLTRSIFTRDSTHTELGALLHRYLRTGHDTILQSARDTIAARTKACFADGRSSEYASGILLDAVLRRLARVSLWGSIAHRTSAGPEAWRSYATLQVAARTPLVELWPSQRRAIDKGLLDGRSSLVLRMPTSAGKTRLTELTFVNDLATHQGRCLYLAPFRALVTDVESSIGGPLSALGYPVATLYGSSDANELEIELAQAARVVIATPEKMNAVNRLSGSTLAAFDTIVIDEGHLLGNPSRGVSLELQLASLRSAMRERIERGERAPRVVFLSAVLPNAGEIARWLTGDENDVADSPWQPTSLRVGIVSWGKARYARVDYLADNNDTAEHSFFVPRLVEEDVWKERHPLTNYYRTHRFPDKKKLASVAAALAVQAMANGPVLVYAQQPRWVNSIATCLIQRTSLARPFSPNLITSANAKSVGDLAAFIARRLGESSLVAVAARLGIGIHHSGVPQGIRFVLEDAFRQQTIKLLIATSTVSQGVNFPARTVLVHSLPESDAPVRDFWNLAGRAGRAMHETEGELLLVRSNHSPALSVKQFLEHSSEWRLKQALDRSNMESAVSQLLVFVQTLLSEGEISAASISALYRAPVSRTATDWSKPIDALDTALLELMVEDIEGADAGVVARLASQLWATSQAESLPDSTDLHAGIEAVIRDRVDTVRALVPSAGRRKRFARSGLTASNASALESGLSELRDRLRELPELTVEGLHAVLHVACLTPELAEVSLDSLSRVTWAWLQTGSYAAALEAAPLLLEDLDGAIEYVEETLGYKLNWILSGLVRLLESSDEDQPAPVAEVDPPRTWMHLLPQYVRYGVSSRELLWIMTLGIHDREYAEELLSRMTQSERGAPTRFRNVVEWLVENENEVVTHASDAWTPYYAKALPAIIARYATLVMRNPDAL